MDLKSYWQLNPEVDYLNYGSFGATPTVVPQAQRYSQDLPEREPIEYVAQERSLESRLDHVRGVMSRIVAAHPRYIALARTATDGVNAVLRSMPPAAGDEIVVTDHGCGPDSPGPHENERLGTLLADQLQLKRFRMIFVRQTQEGQQN